MSAASPRFLNDLCRHSRAGAGDDNHNNAQQYQRGAEQGALVQQRAGENGETRPDSVAEFNPQAAPAACAPSVKRGPVAWAGGVAPGHRSSSGVIILSR